MKLHKKTHRHPSYPHSVDHRGKEAISFRLSKVSHEEVRNSGTKAIKVESLLRSPKLQFFSMMVLSFTVRSE